MGKVIGIFFWMACVGSTFAQQGSAWAGPDTLTCGERGASIGIVTDPCPDCCYSWTPAAGLSCTDCKNPVAKPKTKTTYKVTVTDPNFEWSEKDEVVVDLAFGELLFIPDHLDQGSEEIVLGKLQNNVGNSATTWTFSSPDLGCVIEENPGDPNRATFTPGNEYGKLLVKVKRDNDPGCFFTETLPVNSGVKDLIVYDGNNPDRFAKTGEQLVIVGNYDVRLVAIPNEGGFDEGIPDYKPDGFGSITPEDGNEDQIVVEPIVLGTKISEYKAGDLPSGEPLVTVLRVAPSTETGDLLPFSNAVENFMAYFESLFKFDNTAFGGSPPIPACESSTPLDYSITAGVVQKTTEAELYNKPGQGLKKEIVLDLGVGVTGTLYHPQFTGNFTVKGVGICSKLYAGLFLNGNFMMGLSADSAAANNDWKFDTPQIEFTLGGQAGFDVAVLTGGAGYSLAGGGSASINAKLAITYDQDNRRVVGQVKINPVTIKADIRIVNQNNMGEYVPVWNLLSTEIPLFQPTEYNLFTIYQF